MAFASVQTDGVHPRLGYLGASGLKMLRSLFACICLTEQGGSAWGWRIPLIVGCLIIPFVYMIRRTLQVVCWDLSYHQTTPPVCNVELTFFLYYKNPRVFVLIFLVVGFFLSFSQSSPKSSASSNLCHLQAAL